MKLRNSLALLGLLLFASPVYGQTGLSYGTRGDSISASASCGTGTSFAVPTASSTGVTWTTKFSSAPSAVSIVLEGSLNNSDWYTIDSSTSTAGEIRSFATTALFLRARCVSKTGGGNTTVSLVLNRGSVAFVNASLTGCLSCNNTWTSSNTFTQPVLFADGSVAAPSIAFASATDLGFYRTTASAIDVVSGGVSMMRFSAAGGGTFSIFGASPTLGFGTAGDTILTRDAANTLALRNGTNGQAFRIYNTYTSEVSHLGWQLDANTAGSFLLRYRNNGVLNTVGTFTSGGNFSITGGSLSATNATGFFGNMKSTYGYSMGGDKGWLRVPATDGAFSLRNNAESNTYDITLADWGTTLTPEPVTLANTSVTFIGTNNKLGNFRIVTDQNFYCSYFLRGTTNATVEITDIGGACTAIKDNPSTYNIYYDAAGPSGAGYYLQVLASTSVVWILQEGK